MLAHPECPPEVLGEADFAGSTAAISSYVARQRPPRVVLLTECSIERQHRRSIPGSRLNSSGPAISARTCETDHSLAISAIHWRLMQDEVTIGSRPASPRAPVAPVERMPGGKMSIIHDSTWRTRHHRRRRLPED